MADFFDSATRANLHPSTRALREEHLDNRSRTSVAELLAELFFVVRNAMFFDEGDEVPWGVSGEGGLTKVGVIGEVVIRGGAEVGEVAPASTGDGNFQPDALIVLQDDDAPAPLAGFDGAE